MPPALHGIIKAPRVLALECDVMAGATNAAIRSVTDTKINNLATVREVRAALSAFGIVAPIESIAAISRSNCRDVFIVRLSRCVAGQDSDGSCLDYIGVLLRCVEPATIQRVRLRLPAVTPDLILAAAMTRPRKFLSAIDAAEDEKHTRHADAVAFLTSIFEVDVTPVAYPAANDAGVPRPTPASATTSGPKRNGACNEDGKRYHFVRVYGANAALCFNASTWHGEHGVMVDAAACVGLNDYDWENAIHVWLNRNEVTTVLAVLRRWRGNAELIGHGAQHEKSLVMLRQGEHVFAKVAARTGQGNVVRAVQIQPQFAAALAILFMTQLTENYPSIPLSELLETVRSAHGAPASETVAGECIGRQ